MKYKVSLLWAFFLSYSLAVAQTSDFDTEVDSIPIDEQLDHLFAPLDKSDITTGMLIDRAFRFTDVANHTGQGTDDTLFAYHRWYALYGTIGSGRIDSESGLPDPESWESTVENPEAIN